jgi:hypothetical protein
MFRAAYAEFILYDLSHSTLILLVILGLVKIW